MFKTLLFFALFITFPPLSLGANQVGRLGLGYSGQLENDIPAFSSKTYTSLSFAWGLLGNVSTADDGGFGIGIKGYKNFFAEPNLFFYGSILLALINHKKYSTKGNTGLQFDITLGTEFFIPGIESLGFAVETGLGISTIKKFTIKTIGQNFIAGSVHFYL